MLPAVSCVQERFIRNRFSAHESNKDVCEPLSLPPRVPVPPRQCFCLLSSSDCNQAESERPRTKALGTRDPEITTNILRVQQEMCRSPETVAVLDGMAPEVRSLQAVIKKVQQLKEQKKHLWFIGIHNKAAGHMFITPLVCLMWHPSTVVWNYKQLQCSKSRFVALIRTAC